MFFFEIYCGVLTVGRRRGGNVVLGSGECVTSLSAGECVTSLDAGECVTSLACSSSSCHSHQTYSVQWCRCRDDRLSKVEEGEEEEGALHAT